MSAIDDVREMHEEAERLEGEATDLRLEARAVVAAEALCPVPLPTSPRHSCATVCCGQPYDCLRPTR